MIEITLNAGEKFPVAATSKYLVVRSVGEQIWLSMRGNAEVAIESSDVIELSGVNDVTLINKSTLPQLVKFQISPFKIDAKVQTVNVKAIEEIVTVQMDRDVNIGAVNQDGEWVVGVKSALTNTHKPRVECLPGVATKLFSAGARKSNRINIRSDQLNGVSLGGSNLVDDDSGGFLDVGMVDYMDTSGELWAFNSGGSSIVVDVLELV
jgi:hypothetical protein